MKDIFEGKGAPVSEAGFAAAVTDLGQAADTKAALWSILTVETRGFGFQADRRPKILFERHIFHKRTGGRFSAAHPDISNATAGGYSGGAAEYQRLKRAMTLDRKAALESASWGLGQIMGFNAAIAGFADAASMVNAFKETEDAQLAGCASFITTQPALARAFRQRDWAKVAFFYNGASFKKNRYDEKLASFHAQYKTGTPSVGLRAAQARLTYLGFDPKGIDGLFGGGTSRALTAFQKSKGLPASGQLDSATEQALVTAAGA